MLRIKLGAKLVEMPFYGEGGTILGHKFEKSIEVDISKIKVIEKLTQQSQSKGAEFSWLCKFYLRFIKDLSKL